MCVGDDVDANKEDDDDANEEDEDGEVAAKEEEEDGDVDDDAKEEEDYKEECFQRDRAAAISASPLRKYEKAHNCTMRYAKKYKLQIQSARRLRSSEKIQNVISDEPVSKLDSMSHAEAASDLS